MPLPALDELARDHEECPSVGGADDDGCIHSSQCVLLISKSERKLSPSLRYHSPRALLAYTLQSRTLFNFAINFDLTECTSSTLPGPPQAMAEFPLEVFRHRLKAQLVKHVRPPTVRDLGTKVQKLKPIVVPATLLEEMLSTARGLPPADVAAGIVRLTPEGAVKPTQSTASGDTTKFKLQDPEHIKSFFKLEEKQPSRCEGATRLKLSKAQEKRGLLAKTATMAAAPVRGRAYIPKGTAALRSLPSLTLSLNRIHVDENGEVTFGVMVDKYPPWMKQRLRAEIYKAVIAMGQRRLPIDPDWYERLRYKLADARLCGTHAIPGAPLLADAPPLPSPQRGRRSKRTAAAQTPSSKRTKKQKRSKLTEEAYEITRIVREEGAWGGHKRWFAVEWSHVGYEPSWEAWRNAGGEPGTPVLTWKPLREARCLTAFAEWEAAAAERAAAAAEA